MPIDALDTKWIPVSISSGNGMQRHPSGLYIPEKPKERTSLYNDDFKPDNKRAVEVDLSDPGTIYNALNTLFPEKGIIYSKLKGLVPPTEAEAEEVNNYAAPVNSPNTPAGGQSGLEAIAGSAKPKRASLPLTLALAASVFAASIPGFGFLFNNNNAYADGPVPTPAPISATYQNEEQEYVPGTILVKFKPDADVNGILNKYNLTLDKKIESINLGILRVPEGKETELLQILNSDENVVYAELDRITKAKPEPVSGIYLPEKSLPERVLSGLASILGVGEYIPNEPDFVIWQKAFMDRLGWTKAWYSLQQRGLFEEIAKKEPITIAVIDSGVTNDPRCPNEIPIIGGYDFLLSRAIPAGGYSPSEISNYHGTKVASVIAAVTDNSQCIASVGGKLPIKIMDLRVATASGSIADSNVILALDYAAKNSAKIANMSFGGYTDNKALQDIVNNLWTNYKLIMVASSGNDGVDTPFYPAAYENVLGVGFVDENGIRKPGSNFGINADLMAESGVWAVYPDSSQIPIGPFPSGSGASPEVAAASAYPLLFSKTPEEAINLLKKTAKPNKQIDLYNLINDLLGPEPTPTPSPTPTITPTPQKFYIYLPYVSKHHTAGW